MIQINRMINEQQNQAWWLGRQGQADLLVWSVEWVPGHSELQKETLPQKEMKWNKQQQQEMNRKSLHWTEKKSRLL